MEQFLTQGREYFEVVIQWVDVTLFSYASLAQLGIILCLWLVSSGITYWLAPFVTKIFGERPAYSGIEPYLKALYLPLFWLLMMLVAWNVAAGQGGPVLLLRIASSLIMIWMVLRLASNLIKSPEVARFVRLVVWTVAVLNIFGWLGPVIGFLDRAEFAVGGNSVSVLGIITGIFTLCVLVWSGLFFARLMEGWLRHSPNVSPSARVLLSKLARIVLVAVAFLVALTSVGIDLTALAVFGGAIGVGLGFGLQKVVSNFISGVILLLDRSIKPGDVIEISDTYGRINKLSSRYTSVISRDGREHLVPNEDMITQTVINWTFSHNRVRRHLPVGISYSSDVDRAIELMMEAASETDRVLKEPAARVLIKGFGDNAIDLELRMWIRDSENGVSNVASDVYLAIWRKFNAGGIEFPFPQRDIHIVSAEGLADKLSPS